MQTDAQFIASKLDTLIQKAGHTVERGAEFAWPILVRQQIVEGWVAIGAAFTMWIAAIALFSVYMKTDDEGFVTLAAVACFAAVIASIVALVNLPDLLNPEYGALQDILSTVR